MALRGSVRPDLFAGFRADTFPTTTMTAFALTAAADRTGDPAVSEAVGMALRDALFEEGLDIGRPEVVAPIAERFDLEPLDHDATVAAVRADWAEGQAARRHRLTPLLHRRRQLVLSRPGHQPR